MIEISLAVREACGRSGIVSNEGLLHKGGVIEKRRKIRRRTDLLHALAGSAPASTAGAYNSTLLCFGAQNRL
jgi:hypothetical protein